MSETSPISDGNLAMFNPARRARQLGYESMAVCDEGLCDPALMASEPSIRELRDYFALSLINPELEGRLHEETLEEMRRAVVVLDAVLALGQPEEQ